MEEGRRRGGGLSALWFTSDTRFGHAAVLRHSDRPWEGVGEMNAAIIDNWNANVGAKDTVWHLGDVQVMSDSDATSWPQQQEVLVEPPVHGAVQRGAGAREGAPRGRLGRVGVPNPRRWHLRMSA